MFYLVVIFQDTENSIKRINNCLVLIPILQGIIYFNRPNSSFTCLALFLNFLWIKIRLAQSIGLLDAISRSRYWIYCSDCQTLLLFIIEFLFSANITSFALGIAFGWTSPSVPKLRETDLNINPLGRIPSIFEISWVGSCMPVGALLGILLMLSIF